MVRNFIICILYQYHFDDQTVDKNKAKHAAYLGDVTNESHNVIPTFDLKFRLKDVVM
jgi:hypothetical protein